MEIKKSNINYILVGDCSIITPLLKNLVSQPKLFLEIQNIEEVGSLLSKTAWNFVIIKLTKNDANNIESLEIITKLLAQPSVYLLLIYEACHQLVPFEKLLIFHNNIEWVSRLETHSEFIRSIKSFYSKILKKNQNNAHLNDLKIPLFIKKGEEIKFLPKNDVYFIEKETAKKTLFYTGERNPMVSEKSLDYYVAKQYSGFVKIHSTFLINLSFIESIHKTDGIFCLMKNKRKLPVLRKFQNQFLQIISV